MTAPRHSCGARADLDKAEKLSYVCDLVFLMDYPYNRPANGLSSVENNRRAHLPGNVMRVLNWKDIYDQVKALS